MSVVVGAWEGERGCKGCPEVRLGVENATSESRGAEVARMARSRRRFGRPKLEDEADKRDPLSATSEWRRGHTQRPRGPSGSGPACGPISRPLAAQCFFLFLFMQFLLHI